MSKLGIKKIFKLKVEDFVMAINSKKCHREPFRAWRSIESILNYTRLPREPKMLLFSRNDMKNAAFTLAEVLITLVVIGVASSVHYNAHYTFRILFKIINQ